MINTSLFPYESFGVRLEIKAENRIAWFRDDYDLQKYLIRCKLDERTLKIDYRDKPPVVSKKHKRSVESGTTKKSNRSSSAIRKRTSILDPTGNFTGNAKRK